MDSIQGEVLTVSAARLFEYESAIGVVAKAAKGAEGQVLEILQGHLKDLCDAHLLALLELEG